MDKTENLSPAMTRRRLRLELRRARLDAGLTQEQTARAMDWSLSKLIRIENGTNNISTNDLKALAEYYKVPDEEQVTEWLALDRTSGAPGGAQPIFLSRLPSSSSTRMRHPCRATSRIWSSWLAADSRLYARVNSRADSGRIRQPGGSGGRCPAKAAGAAQPAEAPQMFFVLDESVIRRVVGSKSLMRDQLQRMIEDTEKPNITIEVVPFTAGLVPGLQAQFVIQEFSDASDDELLYLESPRGDALIRDDREEVLAYREYFEQLRRASLGPEGTIKFLNEVTAELS